MKRIWFWLMMIGFAVPAMGQEVRLYTAVDQPIAARVIEKFQKDTGIRVIITTDAEGTKTTGLVERLRAEKANPRADVWWSNEIFHTVRLADEGILTPYESPTASSIPAIFKDPQHRWAAAGIRVRVLQTSGAAKGLIRTHEDLLKPVVKGKVTIAKPVFGTTGGHMAALYAVWGEEKYVKWLNALKANGVKVVGGNATAARYVAEGQMLVCLTDNDDVAAVRAHGADVEMVLPDQQDGQIGTLAIPCSVGLVNGVRNPEAARKLIDFLLSEEVEAILKAGNFAYGSVRQKQDEIRVMPITYAKVAEAMPRAVNLAMQILEQ